MLKLSKQQADTYAVLAELLRQRGRQWLLGYLMGLIIKLSEHDPELRRQLRERARDSE